MARFLQILLQIVTIVKLVACLSEFKTPNSHSMSDLVAQEQRLALHIITSKPELETTDTRRPDYESLRPKMSEHVLRYNPLESRPESVSHQVAPKRIVINLSHSETAPKTGESNPISANIGTSKQPAASQNKSIRTNSLNMKRPENSSKGNSEIQLSKGAIPRPQGQMGSFHESIVSSVRKQGGIPAIVVGDENEIEEEDDEKVPRGKLMLGAEMIDRLATTSRDSSKSVKVVPESRPSEPYVTHASRQNSENFSSQNERISNRQQQMTDLLNPNRNEDDGIKNYRRVTSRAVSSHPKQSDRDDLSRGDTKKRLRLNDASEQLVSLSQKHINWQDSVSQAAKSHHNGDNDGNSDSDVVKVSSSEKFNRPSFNEQTNLVGYQQLMVFEKDRADHRPNQNTHQHDKQKRNDGSGKLRQVAPISRPSFDINLKSERHSEFPPSMTDNFRAHRENKAHLDHGDLTSANGMRVLIAVDETPNTTRKPEQKRVDSTVTHHQKSASEKQISSTGSQTSALLSDKIAGLLDRLKLYTTREQLMKVANELQQYPDQKEAEDLSNANELQETRQNNADSLMVERKPLETFSQAARYEPRIMASVRTKVEPPERNIRNNVPAPIFAEEFVDSLVTSASQRGQYHDGERKSARGSGSAYSSEQRQLTPKLKTKFLDSKRDLQSRIKPDEAGTGTDRLASHGAFEEASNDESANQDSDTDDLTSEDSQSDDANRAPQIESDDQNEYTNNGDLLKTMEASESAYNMLGNDEDDDAPSPSGKTSGFDHTPITGISDSGTSENDAALESTGGNDREDEEIKILEQVIDELVAAERNQKQEQQRSREN